MRERLLILFFLVGLAACANAPDPKPPAARATPAAAPSVPQDGRYEGRGEVTKINRELGSVELKHEEIKDLMPAMQMEFFVKDKALLKDLAVGDRAVFVVEYKHPTETIVEIRKIQ
ncbi:MAG: copper-binding protein [Acidobacteria bacterium]|nr:copper-binding protein [Acidobacteriota bacterium]